MKKPYIFIFLTILLLSGKHPAVCSDFEQDLAAAQKEIAEQGRTDSEYWGVKSLKIISSGYDAKAEEVFITGRVVTKEWYYAWNTELQRPRIWFYKDGKALDTSCFTWDMKTLHQETDKGGNITYIKDYTVFFRDPVPSGKAFEHEYVFSLNGSSQHARRLYVVDHVSCRVSNKDKQGQKVLVNDQDLETTMSTIDSDPLFGLGQSPPPSDIPELNNKKIKSEKDFYDRMMDKYYQQKFPVSKKYSYKDEKAVLLETKGQVYIKKFNTDKFVRITKQISLRPGDVIKTDKDSMTRLVTPNKLISLGSQSIFKVGGIKKIFKKMDKKHNKEIAEWIFNEGYLTKGDAYFTQNMIQKMKELPEKITSLIYMKTGENMNSCTGIRSDLLFSVTDKKSRAVLLKGEACSFLHSIKKMHTLTPGNQIIFKQGIEPEIKAVDPKCLEVTKALFPDGTANKKSKKSGLDIEIIVSTALFFALVIMPLLKKFVLNKKSSS